jgi:hypothetical protein
MENVEIKSVEARRSFLKKVAYVAPAVVVLGSLTLPNSAQASTFSHNTVSATNQNQVASQETASTINGTNIVTSGSSIQVPAQTFGNYTISGADVKEAADSGNGTWSWVNSLFGGATKYFGV